MKVVMNLFLVMTMMSVVVGCKSEGESTTTDITPVNVTRESVIVEIREKVYIQANDTLIAYDVAEFRIPNFPKSYLAKHESVWIETSEGLYCYADDKTYSVTNSGKGEGRCSSKYGVHIANGSTIVLAEAEGVAISYLGEGVIDFNLEFKKFYQ